jgi:cell pole-organizing protein PopZ
MKPYQDIQHVSDVLSSIRQLVSDEVSHLDARAEGRTGTTKTGNVLVLTARDRVDATFRSRHKPDPLPDETVLREMVRSVIREELQGDLGDRITRNVRKMVRREISRALNISLTD